MPNDLGKFCSLVEGIDICMLTTSDAGSLRARPMAPHVDRQAREFHFLTKASSHKTDELAASPAVNLAFSEPKTGDFVSVSGQAYLTRDAKLIDALWTKEAEVYFGSRDDPDLAVIRVVPSIAEYWDEHSTLKQAWNVFKAVAAKEEPDLGENRKLRLA
jgi:general stress protein 26